MTDSNASSILSSLIAVGKIDILLAGVLGRKKQIESDLIARRQAVRTHEGKCESRKKVLDDKRALYAREEKAVKAERDKINDRRQALGSLNNYKVQQAAEKEIAFVSKQIGQREELMMGLLREIEGLEQEMADLQTAITGGKEELEAFEKDAQSSLESLDAELAQLQGRRTEKFEGIGPHPAVSAYNRIRDRFPMNPIVEVVNKSSCAGCHINVGPQVIVQLGRGEVVKCSGCGRLLFLPPEEAAAE
jgi:predicted  nucleic acid-binding Zn-ribbon protein